MTKVVLVMVGGSLGALSRYGISLLAGSLFGGGFPWGTLIVNLCGCFLVGLAASLADRHPIVNPDMHLCFITGFLGALTTFSTFAFESVMSAWIGAYRLVFLNLFLNNVIGFALVGAGWWVGKSAL